MLKEFKHALADEHHAIPGRIGLEALEGQLRMTQTRIQMEAPDFLLRIFQKPWIFKPYLFPWSARK